MKLSRGEKVYLALVYAFLVILTLVFLLPVLTVVATSFVSEAEISRRGAFILFPERWDPGAYKALLGGNSVIVRAYGVTLFRTLVGTLLDLAFTCTLAYMLARRDLPGRAALTVFVFVPMIFSGGLIPSYMVNSALGLVNKVWVLIIPGLISVWNLLLMRNFFMALPREIEEAAIVDGANPLVVLSRIVVPLSMPSISTIGLFYAVGHWNAWFDAAIYITNRALFPVQLILRTVLDQVASTVGTGVVEQMAKEGAMPPSVALKSAMIVISIVPILCVYPSVQRYFVKGVLVGSVKG